MEKLIEQEEKHIAYDCFALAGVDGKHRHCGILKTGEYRIGQGCGGCSFYKTREQFNADYDKAYQKAVEKGFTPEPRRRFATDQEIAEMRMNDLSIEKIAEKMGVEKKEVQRRLKKIGIK